MTTMRVIRSKHIKHNKNMILLQKIFKKQDKKTIKKKKKIC